MGNVMRFNRHKRRARIAVKRREEREELRHHCAVNRAGAAAGVFHEVQVAIPFFHDVHRCLDELFCPRCPVCLELRNEGRIDRAPNRTVTLARWRILLEHEREKACNGR